MAESEFAMQSAWTIEQESCERKLQLPCFRCGKYNTARLVYSGMYTTIPESYRIDCTCSKSATHYLIHRYFKGHRLIHQIKGKRW